VDVRTIGRIVLPRRRFDADQVASFGGGIWWAVTTVTTVGYGDLHPTDTKGRIEAERRRLKARLPLVQ
jgi:voltage-gated potassium channel